MAVHQQRFDRGAALSRDAIKSLAVECRRQRLNTQHRDQGVLFNATPFMPQHGPETARIAQAQRCVGEDQIDVIVRRTAFRKRKAEERAHILRGLLKALDMLDEVIATIRRSASADVAREALTLTRQNQENLQGLQNKLGGLDARFSETQGQQVALEAMYQEFSRTRDDRVLSEVDQAVTIAAQQLQLAGNVHNALAALQIEGVFDLQLKIGETFHPG